MFKKWLLLSAVVLLVLTAAGCNKDTGGPPPSNSGSPAASGADPSPSVSASPSAAPSADTEKPIMDAFLALLKTPGNEKEALAAIHKDVSKLSPENASRMLLSFENYQLEAIKQPQILTDKLIKSIEATGEFYTEKILNDPAAITNADIKTEVQTLVERGYKIIVPEGMYEAVINYAVLQDTEQFLTPDIALYIEIMTRESNARSLEDAAIIVPVDEILDRTLTCESFIGMFANSERFDQIRLKYNNYIDTYFLGQNNTPAFAYDTLKLDQEFLDSYQKAAQRTSSDSALVKAAADYLKALQDNNYTLTDAVTAYRKSLIADLKK